MIFQRIYPEHLVKISNPRFRLVKGNYTSFRPEILLIEDENTQCLKLFDVIFIRCQSFIWVCRPCKELTRESFLVSHLCRSFIESAFYTDHTWGVIIFKIMDHTIYPCTFISFVHYLVFHIWKLNFYHVFVCWIDFASFYCILYTNTCFLLFLLNMIQR